MIVFAMQVVDRCNTFHENQMNLAKVAVTMQKKGNSILKMTKYQICIEIINYNRIISKQHGLEMSFGFVQYSSDQRCSIRTSTSLLQHHAKNV